MAAYYEVILNGSYLGKDNKNSLYYRTAIDPAGGLFGFGGASEVAEEVLQEVVPAFLATKPNSYMLQTIDVIPRNELFSLLYQLPYKKDVMQLGTSGWLQNSGDSPALAVNVRFNLEPTVIGLQAFTAPKRGYVAIGPLPSTWLDDSGKISDALLTDPEGAIKNLESALSQNLESIDPPAIFFPIRVSKHYGGLGGGLLGYGYADVSSCSFDQYATFRRTRRITG